MGCVFSRNHVRIPRIFKRKTVSRSRKNIISTSPTFEHKSTRGLNSLTTSDQPATPNVDKAAWYTPDVAPSTLAWLIGAKDCLEDSIPELANAKANKNNNNNNRETNKQDSTKGDIILPPCLNYEGFHEYGYHIFTLNSSVFNSTIQDMSLDCLSEAISSVLGSSNKPVVLVYKDSNNQTTYLPNPAACGKDVLNSICTRFGEQILRVIIYKPSWFLQVVLDEQTDSRRFFSDAVTEKLRVTSDFKELAKLTGFPGEIRSKD